MVFVGCWTVGSLALAVWTATTRECVHRLAGKALIITAESLELEFCMIKHYLTKLTDLSPRGVSVVADLSKMGTRQTSGSLRGAAPRVSNQCEHSATCI